MSYRTKLLLLLNSHRASQESGLCAIVLTVNIVVVNKQNFIQNTNGLHSSIGNIEIY